MSYESIVITKHANLTWFAKDNTMPLDNDGIFLSGWTGGANNGLFTLKSENGGIAYNNQLWSIFSYVDVLDSGNNFTPTSPIDLAVKLRQRGFFDDGSSGEGGVDTFLQLLDVLFPNYAGRAGQIIRINSGETGLESVTPSFAFQNNIGKWYTQSIPGTGDITPAELSALINSGAQFLFTVTETSTPVFISALRTEGGITKKYVFLFMAGKPPTGTIWGAGGTPTTPSQFRLFIVDVLTPEDVQNAPNSEIFPLGDTTGENFWDVASLQDPPYDLTDSGELDADGNPRTYYFSFIDSGELKFAQFIGTPGYYGVGETSFVMADFVVITNGNVTNNGVITVTGNLVDNADPQNPVVSAAEVAITGDYNDLINTPEFASVSTESFEYTSGDQIFEVAEPGQTVISVFRNGQFLNPDTGATVQWEYTVDDFVQVNDTLISGDIISIVYGQFVGTVEVNLPKTSILPVPFYTGVADRLPNFFEKWLKREQDVTVVVYGDSLSVRSTNNTAFAEPQYRPPLCHTQNWAAAVWDKVKWGREKFWRYDGQYDGSPRFSESGSFVTVTPNGGDSTSNGVNSTVWDDYTRREGFTRMFKGVGTASVTFSMIDTTDDKEASLNFIYRTDLTGSTINTVTIAEGDDLLVVYDEGTSAWVEANGYTFSMLHPGVSTYRGNTKFNATLKFKAVTDSMDTTDLPKTITITKTDTADTRFMYWGIQTSVERYMVNIISAGRGGLQLETLEPFIDDDVYDHHPDLIVHQLPINGGINGFPNPDLPSFYTTEADDWFFSAANPRSLKEMSNDWADFEVVIWSPHATWGATDETFLNENTFNTAKLSDGKWYGVQDNWRQMAVLMQERKEPGFYYVDMFERWLLESIAVYGNIKAGFATTNTTSEESFIRDGTHMNDLGVKIMAKNILSIFNFQQ